MPMDARHPDSIGGAVAQIKVLLCPSLRSIRPNVLTPKTASAGLSGSASVPVATIAIWLIEMIPTSAEPHHVVVPAAVAAALAAFMATAAAFLGSYFTPRSDPTPDQVVSILQKHAQQQDQPQNQNWNTQA